MSEQNYKDFFEEAMNQIHAELSAANMENDFILNFNFEYVEDTISEITVSVASEFMWNRMVSKGNVEKVQKKINELTGQNISIKHVVNTKSSETPVFVTPAQIQTPKKNADSEKKEEKQVDSEELKAIKDVIENSKKKEKYILNKSNELKYLKFDSELLMPSIYADNSIVIEKNEKELNRKLYDDYFRLKLVETWNISTVIDSKIIKTEKYEYKENTQICIKKEEKTDNMLKIYEYNEKGYVEKTSETEIYKDKEYPLKKTEIKYDDENRVIEESTTENFYKDKKDRIPDKITKTKYKYSYNNENNIPPDFEYFENGELKMKNVYSNIKGTYTSKIFFDDSFAVTTYYEDEIRKKDVYTMNGVEKRVEVYE